MSGDPLPGPFQRLRDWPRFFRGRQGAPLPPPTPLQWDTLTPMPIGEFKRHLSRFLPDPLYQFRLKPLAEIQSIVGETEAAEGLLLVLSTAWEYSNSLRRVLVNDKEFQADIYFGVTTHRIFLSHRSYDTSGVGRFLGITKFQGWERYNRRFSQLSGRFDPTEGGFLLREATTDILLVGRREQEQNALSLVGSFIASRRDMDQA